MRRPPRRGEEGFTLIELLIVLVILPLVMGAITVVLITTLKDQQGVQGRVTDSAASATATSFFVRDVQSASYVTTSATTTPHQCTPTPGLGTPPLLLLGLQLQAVAPAAPSVVSYYMVTPSNAPPELVRYICTNGSSVPQSRDLLSDDLSASDPPVPVVPCISPTPTSIPQGVTCSPGQGWTPTYLVSAVTLNVTQGQNCPTAAACPLYQYTLTGLPQSGIPVPPVVQPCGVLTLLGAGTDVSFAAAASQTVQASGPIVLDSGYTGNPAIYGAFIFNDAVTATSSPSCSSIPASDSLEIYDCQGTASSGSSANFQPCPTSGSHDPVSPGITVSPAPVQTVAMPSDPMAAWAQENAGGANITVTGTGSCTTGTMMTCEPGLYPNGLSIANGKTVKFDAGNYQFGSNACGSSLCIGSSDTVDFGTGHYIYTNGINVAGSGSTLCGGGVVNSSCPTTNAGVFFYVKSGATNLGNLSSGNVIDLGAITNPTDDPYAGVLLWQDGSDSENSITLTTAGTSAINNLGGTIYAPNATIDLGAASVGQSVIDTGPIVAQGLNFSLSYQLQLNVG